MLMSSTSGSEVLFEDLRERYRRAMDTPELTSPSVRVDDSVYDDGDGFELLDHPTDDIDPLNDYLEMHSIRTGVHSRIDERSDPLGLPAWPSEPIPGMNRVDTPPPQEFSRAPTVVSEAGTEPGLIPMPASPPPTLQPALPPAPPAVHSTPVPNPYAQAQGAQPHHTPSAEGRLHRPRTDSANHAIPIERAYRQVYGRTIRPNPSAEFGSTGGQLHGVAYSPSQESELDLQPEPTAARNPHRWDGWILAGFAISGIWALALVRVIF